MTWNYRVFQIGDQFEIHEVFYDEDGSLKSYTEVAVFPRAETKAGFLSDFERYGEALNKPILGFDETGEIVVIGSFRR